MTDWSKAVCRMRPDAWHPDGASGLPTRREAEQDAAEACLECPVMVACGAETARREANIPPSKWWGVFAGETADERRARLRRDQRRRLKARRHGVLV